jgi:hypothetical protein
VPPVPTRPDVLRGKVFRGSTVLRAGRLTRGQLRSTAWQRLFPDVYFPDVYACASLRVNHELRALAAVGVLVPDAVLCRSAAVLWGVDLAGPGDDVECTVDGSCRAGTVRGLRVSRRALPAENVPRRHGLRLTTPLRTALDLARIEPFEEAVVCLDRFLVAGLVSLDRVRSAAAAMTGPGCRQVRRRLNRLTAAGWRVVFVTAADLHDPVQLLARIAAALSLPGYA